SSASRSSATQSKSSNSGKQYESRGVAQSKSNYSTPQRTTNAGSAQRRSTPPVSRSSQNANRPHYSTPANSVSREQHSAPVQQRQATTNRGNGNNRPNVGNNNGNRPNVGNRPNNGNDRPNVGNRPNNGNNRPNVGNRPHNGNHRGDRDYGKDYDGRRPGYHTPNHSNPRGYKNHFNDRFHDHYRHNDWSWSRPCPPPHRPWRPTPWRVYRPIVPSGWVWYHSAPRIYRVLGLQFGTVFTVSINHLFTYGYNIDGYYDNVIYLRDVPMLNYNWSNVMLNYAPGGGFASAMFSNSFAARDLNMFNRLYSTLCSTYGSPVEAHTNSYEGTVSWWGGNGEGFVTLNYYTDSAGRFYTNLTIGN
ncbi:MAG: hypothetical protein KIG57_01365, partial [Muribaculaceae bacterium]|nr:hypothetical protein [Muribaculaceae bacterium]